MASPSRSSSVARYRASASFSSILEQLDLLGLARRDDVDRREVVVDVHAQVRPRLALVFGRNLLGALRQIADVADAGLDREAAAQDTC